MKKLTEQELFDIVQQAYKRGVDWTAEFQNWDGHEYAHVWKHVPKASYDYADKIVSSIPPKPNKGEIE